MSDREIDAIADRLIDLALEGDKEAAERFADFHVVRRNWERGRSLEIWQDLVNQAQNTQAWLATKA